MAAESRHGKFYTVPFRWVGAKRKAFCSRADDRSVEKIVKNRVSVGRVGEICRFERGNCCWKGGGNVRRNLSGENDLFWGRVESKVNWRFLGCWVY